MLRVLLVSLLVTLTVTPLSHAEQKGPAPAIVTLLDSGDPLRTLLRYQVKEGQSEQLRMTTEMSQSIDSGVQDPIAYDAPPIVMTMEIDVLKAHDDGALDIAWSVTDTEVLDSDAALPGVVEAMSEAMLPMIGVTGSYTVSATGAASGSEVHIADDVPDAMRQTMEDMNRNAANLTVALPDEAVGLGAEWAVVSEMLLQNLIITQTVRATLISIDGDRVRYDIAMEQTAEAGQVLQEVPGQYRTTLEGFAGFVSGQVEVDLTRLAPIKSRADGGNTLELLTTGSDGSSIEQRIETSMVMTIEGVPIEEE